MMHKRVLITGLSSDSFLEFSFLSSFLLSLSLYIRWPPGLSTYRSAFPSVLPSSSCVFSASSPLCISSIAIFALLVFSFSPLLPYKRRTALMFLSLSHSIEFWRKRTVDCRKMFQLLDVPHAHQKLCASPERRCCS